MFLHSFNHVIYNKLNTQEYLFDLRLKYFFWRFLEIVRFDEHCQVKPFVRLLYKGEIVESMGLK